MLGERGIDHLVLAVQNLQSARQAYQSMGFTVTPVAEHPFGTSNALVQMQTGFLELLAVTDTDRITPAGEDVFSFGHFNEQYLSQREGFSMLVYQTQDARADQQGFKRAGLKTFNPFDFSRQATLPDGQQVEVSFSLALVADEMSADNAMFFCCQQHAPQHFWKPDYQRHANGCRDIGDVYMLTRDLSHACGFFQTLHGAHCVKESNASQSPDQSGVLVCSTGSNRVVVFDETGYARHFSDTQHQAPNAGMAFFGFSVRGSDKSATRQSIEQSEFSWAEFQQDSFISRSGIHGATIVFEHEPSQF